MISDEPLVPNGSVPPDRAETRREEESAPRSRRHRAKSKAGRDKSTSKGLDRDHSTARTVDSDHSSSRGLDGDQSGPLDRDASTDRSSSRRRPRAESKRRRRFSGYRTPRSRSQEDLLDAAESQNGNAGYDANFREPWPPSGNQRQQWWEGYHEGYYGNSYDYGQDVVNQGDHSVFTYVSLTTWLLS